MKKLAVTALIITTLILSGCMPKSYTFPNKDEPVEKIELLYNPHASKGNIGGPMETICTLDDENADAFLGELYQLDTYRRTPPGTGYGFYVAQVIYQNGDIEMFGRWHIELIRKGSEPTRVGAYYFSGDGFEKLFCEYAGITSFDEDMAERAATTAPSRSRR